MRVVRTARTKSADPTSRLFLGNIPDYLIWYPYRFVHQRIERLHRTLNPRIRAKLLVADVDEFYFRRNWHVPTWLNNYLCRYFTPRVGEVVESCGTEIRRDYGDANTIGKVKKVDLVNHYVLFEHGGMDAFQCVDPIGWRNKYLQEDGSPIE